MIKLKKTYREALKEITGRDYIDNFKKYYSIDGVVQVMIRDPEVNVTQLKIALKYRGLFFNYSY